MNKTSVNNSPSFGGYVRADENLDRCMKYATNRSLQKFEKLLTRIGKVDDKWNYSLKRESFVDKVTCKTMERLTLASNSLGVVSFRPVGETPLHLLDSALTNKKLYGDALKKIMNFIEDDYSKVSGYNKRKGLLDRISDLLK